MPEREYDPVRVMAKAFITVEAFHELISKVLYKRKLNLDPEWALDEIQGAILELEKTFAKQLKT